MSELTRRDAIAIMGAVPLAAAWGTTPEVVEGAIAAAQQARAHQQAQQAGQQPPPGIYQPRFFDAHEWQTVRTLVDLIIPRDDRSGSATDAGVPEFMDFMVMERDSMRLPMRGGLRWIDNQSLDRFGKRFIELDATQQAAILDEIAWPERAAPAVSQGVNFFNFLRDFTASGFWSSRMGVADIGYLGNEFRPEWDGCPPAAMERLGVTHDVMKSRIPIQRGE